MDMSTPLLPEIVLKIDANSVNFHDRKGEEEEIGQI